MQFRKASTRDTPNTRKRFEADETVNLTEQQKKLLGGQVTKRPKQGPQLPPTGANVTGQAAATNVTGQAAAAANVTGQAASTFNPELTIGGEMLTKEQKRKALEDFGDDEDLKRQRKVDKVSTERQIVRSVQKSHQCSLCIGTERCEEIRRGLFICSTDRVWLASQPLQDMLIPFHSTIASIDHIGPSEFLEPETRDEIRDVKKALVYFFKSLQSDWFSTWGYQGAPDRPFVPIFIEWSTHPTNPEWMQIKQQRIHASIDVLPLREEDFEEAMVILKREFLDAADVNQTNQPFREFSPSPKLGVESVLPRKGSPYIYVDFGLEKAYLYLIEDTRKFSRRYIRELLKSLLPDNVGRYEGYSETATLKFDMELYISEYNKKFRL